MECDLLTKTLSELTRRRGHWPAICRDTGLDYNWLTKLAQGHIKDPGVKKIQRLHDHFFQQVAAPDTIRESLVVPNFREAA